LPEHLVVSSRSSEVKATFSPVSNESPSVSLHGGIDGFDEKLWQPILFPPSPGDICLFSDKELGTLASQVATAALFKAISEDGEQGFPGRLRVEVLVGLTQPTAIRGAKKGEWNLGSIILIYRAKLIDDKKTVTPINLTHHWGFNLDASMESNASSIKDHKLTIKALKTLDRDPAGLATGKLTSHEASSPFNFNSHPTIGSIYPESGYDDFYIFDRTEESIPKIFNEHDLISLDYVKDIVDEQDQENEAKVVLEGGKSGIKLNFFSNQSGVQFYSNTFSTGFGVRKKIHGGDGSSVKKPGRGYDKGTAAFLEFHEPYPAFLHPSVSPSGHDTLLTSGEIYNNYVKINVAFQSQGL